MEHAKHAEFFMFRFLHLLRPNCLKIFNIYSVSRSLCFCVCLWVCVCVCASVCVCVCACMCVCINKTAVSLRPALSFTCICTQALLNTYTHAHTHIHTHTHTQTHTHTPYTHTHVRRYTHTGGGLPCYVFSYWLQCVSAARMLGFAFRQTVRQTDNQTPPPQPPHPVRLSEVETFRLFASSQLPPYVVGQSIGFGVLHHTQPQRPIWSYFLLLRANSLGYIPWLPHIGFCSPATWGIFSFLAMRYGSNEHPDTTTCFDSGFPE